VDVSLPFPRMAVLTIDVTLSFAPVSLQEVQPILGLVTAGFLMALILLMPAVIAAAWHGCQGAGRSLAARGVRHRPESP
jgi:hypothetical protein